MNKVVSMVAPVSIREIARDEARAEIERCKMQHRESAGMAFDRFLCMATRFTLGTMGVLATAIAIRMKP